MNDEELRKFNQFEEIEIQDPYAVRVITEALELEKVLNAKPYDEMDELERTEARIYSNDVIARMNRECPHYGQEVMVKGRVVTASYDEIARHYSILPKQYTNDFVESQGYLVILKADENGMNKYVVGHNFIHETLPPQSTDSPLINHIPELHSFADVGSVDVTYATEDGRRADTLRFALPSIMEGVDAAFEEAGSPIVALRQLSEITLISQDIPTGTLHDLLGHSYDELNFDSTIPYVAQIRGSAYMGQPTEKHQLSFEHFGKVSPLLLVSPQAMRLAPYPEKDEDGYTLTGHDHFALRLRVIGSESGEDQRDILVPVANIKNMQSLRDFVPDRLTDKEE